MSRLLRFPAKGKKYPRCFTDGTLSHDGIIFPWRADACGLFEEIPDEWVVITGQRPDAARDVGWTKMIHPDDHDGATRRWLKALGTASLVHLEFRVLAATGEYVKLTLHGGPVFNPDNQLTHWEGETTIYTKYPSQVIRLSTVS